MSEQTEQTANRKPKAEESSNGLGMSYWIIALGLFISCWALLADHHLNGGQIAKIVVGSLIILFANYTIADKLRDNFKSPASGQPRGMLTFNIWIVVAWGLLEIVEDIFHLADSSDIFGLLAFAIGVCLLITQIYVAVLLMKNSRVLLGILVLASPASLFYIGTFEAKELQQTAGLIALGVYFVVNLMMYVSFGSFFKSLTPPMVKTETETPEAIAED